MRFFGAMIFAGPFLRYFLMIDNSNYLSITIIKFGHFREISEEQS